MKKSKGVFYGLVLGMLLSFAFEVYVAENFGIITMLFISVCIMHDLFYKEEK